MGLEQADYTVSKSNTPTAGDVEVGFNNGQSNHLLSPPLKTVHLHIITNGQFYNGLAAESRGCFLLQEARRVLRHKYTELQMQIHCTQKFGKRG